MKRILIISLLLMLPGPVFAADPAHPRKPNVLMIVSESRHGEVAAENRRAEFVGKSQTQEGQENRMKPNVLLTQTK